MIFHAVEFSIRGTVGYQYIIVKIKYRLYIVFLTTSHLRGTWNPIDFNRKAKYFSLGGGMRERRTEDPNWQAPEADSRDARSDPEGAGQ